MQVEDVVDGIIQQAQQKQRSTATQRKQARLRQIKCRAKAAEEEVQTERDQRSEESWRQRRAELRVVSLFESEPGVLCANIAEQLQQCRLFARRLIVRPTLQPGDTYRSFFERVLLVWCSPRWRCAGRSLERDELIYNVRFNYRQEDVPVLLQEMTTDVNPDEQIDVAGLKPLKWKSLPARPAQSIDEKVQRAHEGHDQQVRDERCIASGKFSIIDDGNAFLIKPDCSETGWRFPRTFPSAQIHVHWNLLALAHQYLQNNPNDERFCPDVRARIARVYEFRLQSTKTNFARGMQEE